MSTAETTTEQGQPFDPSQGMITLGKGRDAKQYLTVNWRVEWLRQEHPDARVVTELLRLEEDSAVFKATVTLPSGAVGVGHGSQTARQFPSFLEKAETKAIGRALAALGYGTLAAFLEDGDGETLADAPVAQPQRREPTPITPALQRVQDWPDEKLIDELRYVLPEAQEQRVIEVYMGRATDRDSLLDRAKSLLAAGRDADDFKGWVSGAATARGDALNLPRKAKAPQPPADELTAVVGEPEHPQAKRIALIRSLARQAGWEEERLLSTARNLYRTDDFAKWSPDQLDSLINFLRSGNHQAAG